MLCAIHHHHERANILRERMGLSRIPYHWIADRRSTSTARRERILTYWMRVHARTLTRYKRWRKAQSASPWSASWYAAAMCVHSHEGGWNDNTGNGYTGGMQYDTSTWLANGGGRYAPEAYLASPHDQLLVAFRTWRARGWTPWPTTAAMCGLL